MPLKDLSDVFLSDDQESFYGPSKDFRIIAIVLLAMISISGVIGNSLVFLSVLLEPKLRIVSSIFIVNISVVGFLFSTVSIPLHIYNLISSRNHLATGGPVCKMLGYLNFTFLLATLISSCAIAINRYIVITKPKIIYLRQYTAKRNTVWIVSLWVIPAALAACGIPYYGYHDNVMACSLVSSSDAYWFICVLIGGPTAVTFIVILVLYYSIFKTVRSSKRRINVLAQHQAQKVRVFNINKPGTSTEHILSEQSPPLHNTDLNSIETRINSVSPSDSTLDGFQKSNRTSRINKYKVSVHRSEIEQTDESKWSTDKGKRPLSSRTDCRKGGDQSRGTGREVKERSKQASARGSDKGAIEITNKPMNHMEIFYTDGQSRMATELPLHDEKISHIRANASMNFDEERSIQIRRSQDSEVIQITDTCTNNPSSTNKAGEKQMVIINTKSEEIQYEIKLTFHLFVVFAVYCILFLPMSFTYLVNKWHPVDPDTWIIVQIMASSYFALAWILYGLLHGKFRGAYKKVLKCERCREKMMRNVTLNT